MKREGSGLYCEWCGEELECPCTPAAERAGTMEPSADRLEDRTAAPTEVDRSEAANAGSNPAPPAVPLTADDALRELGYLATGQRILNWDVDKVRISEWYAAFRVELQRLKRLDEITAEIMAIPKPWPGPRCSTCGGPVNEDSKGGR